MDSRIKAPHTPPTPGETLFLAIIKSADGLGQQAEQLMKSAGLTGAQYNVLRILRGADDTGLPCSTVADRMISRDPDMTRLLDRMEKRNFITRERQKDDRRVVKARITEEGLALLKKLDLPIRDLHRKQFDHMTAAHIKLLTDLLQEVVERHAGHRSCGNDKVSATK